MNTPFYLCFDLGTTSLKVAAIGVDGQLLGQIAKRHVEHRDHSAQWQSADTWWQDAQTLCRSLLTTPGLSADALLGCSVSGRAGAGVLLDDNGEVLVQPWSDNRHAGELRDLLLTEPSMELYGATLTAKLLWIRQHLPQQYDRARHMLYAKDLLIFRLTGQAVTDPSSSTGHRFWPDQLTADINLNGGLFPDIRLPWDLAGTVTNTAAAALGINSGIPVAVGAHDGVAANIGVAALSSDRFALTLGTHCVIRTVSQDLPAQAQRFYCFPPAQHVIGANALWAGRALDWFMDTWDTGEVRTQAFQALDTSLANATPGAGGVQFLPFLGGRLSPTRRPHDRASFTGISLNTGREQLFQAIVEGVSFAIFENFLRLRQWTGEPEYIGLTGSGVQSRLWVQTLADLINQPLTLTDAAAECRGVAILAAVASGHHPNLADAVAAMVHEQGQVQPRGEMTDKYQELFRTWQQQVAATAEIDNQKR